MTAAAPPPLVPKLRFPEFRETGDWGFQPLGSVAELISEKVGTTKCVPMSITTGVGLVCQEDKFGRIIAGDSYKNYIKLRTNDFAYNKSATKEFPQGYIARYTGTSDAGVPNSIFTCFRPNPDAVVPDFLDHLFHGNHHGRWLRKYITVGARAHGALSVRNEELFAMAVPLPPDKVSREEQQRIADCLGSLDDLIAAEGRRLEALRRHKQGLMQQLFPQPGETVPRLRFPEFEDGTEWKVQHLGSAIDLISGVHLAPDAYADRGECPYFTGPTDFTNDLQTAKKWSNESTAMSQRDDILITVKGSGVGQLWHLELDRAVIGRQLMAARSKSGSHRFLFYLLETQRRRLEDLSLGNLIPGLSRSDILTLRAAIPSSAEQQRVAECLSVLDDQISAHVAGLAHLHDHKSGLLQQLFPSLEEETP